MYKELTGAAGLIGRVGRSKQLLHHLTRKLLRFLIAFLLNGRWLFFRGFLVSFLQSHTLRDSIKKHPFEFGCKSTANL